MKKAKEKNSENSSGTSKNDRSSFASANDMDNSFSAYLADLKKFTDPLTDDKDALIKQADYSMNIFRENIFSFAPAVENLCQILDDIINNSKIRKDDVFFFSSLKSMPQTQDINFFHEWKMRIETMLAELKKSYDSPDGPQIRCNLIKECCTLKINSDYSDIFFNRICDYLTLWSEKDSIKIRNPQNLFNSYSAEQRKFLAEKFLLPEKDLTSALSALFDANMTLTDSKHTILSNHLRLVISIAKDFRNRGVSFNDIVQEGNLGLMRAIDKFDPHLGHKFSTYAVWWIKQNIINSIAEQSRTIRIPVHMLRLINKINHAEQELLQLAGLLPRRQT